MTRIPKKRPMQPNVGAPDLLQDRDLGRYSVGRGTYWHRTVQFFAYRPQEKIVIGRYCSLASGVFLHAGGDHNTDAVSTWPFDFFLGGEAQMARAYKTRKSVTTIGSDVWIGQGAFIGSGVTAGHGAVIGARAVVTADVAAYAIVGGNPARLIRYRFDEATVAALLRIAWWDWSPEVIAARRESFYGPMDAFIAAFDPARPSAPTPPAAA